MFYYIAARLLLQACKLVSPTVGVTFDKGGLRTGRSKGRAGKRREGG